MFVHPANTVDRLLSTDGLSVHAGDVNLVAVHCCQWTAGLKTHTCTFVSAQSETVGEALRIQGQRLDT